MTAFQKNLLVGAIQMNTGPHRDKNHSTALTLMTEAVSRGATLLALPENFSYIGDDPGEKLAHAEDPVKSPSVELLRSFAADNGVAVIGGSIPLRTADPSKVTSTTLVIDKGGSLVTRYDKIHLFDANLGGESSFRESEYVQPGSATVSFSLMGWQIGLSICYDLRFPGLYRTLATEGAEVFFVPSAFTQETGRAHWEVLLRARAIENLCYVVAPAQWGTHSATRASYGRSMVVSPWGEIIGECQDGEGIVVSELDASLIQQARTKLPGIGEKIHSG